MKKLLSILIIIVFTARVQAQFLDFESTEYYTATGNQLTASGQNLSGFNFDGANATHPLFNDGVYYHAIDYLGYNIWVRVRYLAADPNGTSVGVNVTATASSPFRAGGFGGWAGFLYQFDIYKDINARGALGNALDGLFLTNISVESIETLSAGELVLFEILNSESSNWVLTSINFTGFNPTSNPGFSAVNSTWADAASFSTTFPPATKNIYVIDKGSGGYYAEFKINADRISQFKYGYEYTGGAGGYQGMRMYFGQASVTPLRLLSFNVMPQDNYVSLSWNTADEINTKAFDVERSTDGSSFSAVVKKEAIGNGSNSYAATDAHPINGTGFYRLKMTDVDGTFTYSKTIKVSARNAGNLYLVVYPNPVKLVLHITAAKSQEIMITDLQGKLIEKRKLASGMNNIPVSNYSNGIYILKSTEQGVDNKKIYINN